MRILLVMRRNLNTVSYGTACASFLATKCLKILAKSVLLSYPVVSSAIISDVYMNDLLTGAETIKEITKLQQGIHSSLASVHFSLENTNLVR